MKTITVISGFFALFLAGHAYSADLYRDDFDGVNLVDGVEMGPWVSVKCDYDSANISTMRDPGGEFGIFSYDNGGCVNVREANGQLSIETANSATAAIGGGVVLAKNRPDFNFFGPETVDPLNPHKRVFKFNNFNFAPSALFPHQKAVSFVVVKTLGLLHFFDRFEVVLFENNYFAIYAVSGGVTKRVYYNPAVRAPLTPHSVEIELGPADYRVTFLFDGGGLYFTGQHELDRASWEATPPDANGDATAGNFYPSILVATQRPYNLDTMNTFNIDSLVVTDGQ